MYITKQTDYSLRTLMLLALQPRDELMSIAEISETLMSSGVGDMSQYQHFMGQVSALAFMEQTLSKIKTNMETLDDD